MCSSLSSSNSEYLVSTEAEDSSAVSRSVFSGLPQDAEQGESGGDRDLCSTWKNVFFAKRAGRNGYA